MIYTKNKGGRPQWMEGKPKLEPLLELTTTLELNTYTRLDCIPEYRDFSIAEIGFLPNLVNLKGKMLQNMPK